MCPELWEPGAIAPPSQIRATSVPGGFSALLPLLFMQRDGNAVDSSLCSSRRAPAFRQIKQSSLLGDTRLFPEM